MMIGWIIVPAVILGWVTGYFNGHIVASIVWGLIILYMYPRSARRWGGRFDPAIFSLSLTQAVVGGLITYFIGVITH